MECLADSYPLLGSSLSPAALSAAEDLISYAIQKGHLSPRYIQLLILNEEVCLVPQKPVMPRKGKTLNLASPSCQLSLNHIRECCVLLVFTGFLDQEHLMLRSKKF